VRERVLHVFHDRTSLGEVDDRVGVVKVEGHTDIDPHHVVSRFS